MRLQVYLSHSGACSRRRALEYIQSGRVKVNGEKILEPSFSVTPSDAVLLDGRQISLKEKTYILLNKPKGVITTTKDRFAPKKITDLLPVEFKHLHPVGRLDRDTTGLIVLTNDGEMAFRLSHPSFEIDKAYKVVLDKSLKLQDKYKIEKGVLLDAEVTSPCRIVEVRPRQSGPRSDLGEEVEIVIHEGRKRQVRRMFASLGYYVVELCRIRQGSMVLGSLQPGAWRFLTKEEIGRLYKELKIT